MPFGWVVRYVRPPINDDENIDRAAAVRSPSSPPTTRV
jgi:hypothetical protein